MKSKLFNLLFQINKALLVIFTFNKLKLYVYTDSRGFNVISKLGKTPYGSYIQRLIKKYNIKFSICPEKFTTIVDFLEVFTTKENWKNYDFVIMHCGVVDFSPRPLSNIQKVKQSKEANYYFDDLFKSNASYYEKPLDVKYYNEDTIIMYSEKYLQEEIGPRLAEIKNLIWIDSNHFVVGWEGNFEKGRPSNIEYVVNNFDKILAKFVRHRISIKDWTTDQIKEYTIDNIHFTKSGFNEMYKRINEKLKQLSKKAE